MTPAEIQQLTHLLRQVAAEGLGVPRLPKPVFEALKGVVMQPAVELLITSSGRDVLLTRRVDRHWSGYHIPGGFVACEESVEAACERVGRAELGVSVTFERIVGQYAWQDHPYASALSLLCLCRINEPPCDGEFFESLPLDLLAPHRELIETYWRTR